MVSFNGKAILCFIPVIAVVIGLQGAGLDELAVILMGPILIVMDLGFRFTSKDHSMISPASGGHISILPIWFVGIIFTIFGIEELTGLNFWVIAGIMVLVVVLIVVLVSAIDGTPAGADGSDHPVDPADLFRSIDQNPCPECSEKLEFIEQYERWYCYNCEVYH